jgi:hypothetical protein
MRDPQIIAEIRRRYLAVKHEMDERRRRQWAAAEARALGWGGVTAVAQATGLSRTTITAGLRELSQASDRRAEEAGRVRRRGGGRRPLTAVDSQLRLALEALIEPATRRGQQSPLRWTCKSTRRLAEDLTLQDHPINPRTVAKLLKDAGYNLRANRKTHEDASRIDGAAQFEYINLSVRRFHDRDQPAISLDIKTRTLSSAFRDAAQEWRPGGRHQEVRVHEFLDQKQGKTIPSGFSELLHKQSWISVGIDSDTAQFAVNGIRRWWHTMGRQRFPDAKELLIIANAGGSDGHRRRLWQLLLQKLADELKLKLFVCHFPAGTTKWNGVQQRLFSFLVRNWGGRPLVSHEAVVSLSAKTTTGSRLTVKAVLDTNRYDGKISGSDEQLASLQLTPHDLCGGWNYAVLPRP